MTRTTWNLTVVCAAASLALAAGCTPVNRKQMTKEVLDQDPEFSSVLDKYREAKNRLETYKRELALKRYTIESEIGRLRKELADAVAQARQKTVHAKQMLEPERERLNLALSLASEQLRSKRAQRASIGRSIAELRKAAKTSGGVSPEERAQRERELAELLDAGKQTDHEIAGLNEHVRLLKMKLLLIRL